MTSRDEASLFLALFLVKALLNIYTYIRVTSV